LLFEAQKLDGVFIIKPNLFKDDRGVFIEIFKHIEFKEKLNCNFVQDNQIYNRSKNILRGLHYQIENPQGKLIHVVSGAILDVIVDIRIGSPNFGKTLSVCLDSTNCKLLFVPPGYAHGYLVLEENTVVHYKCTDYYNPKSEYGIRWDDSDLNIPWKVSNPILSEKDKSLPFLNDQKMFPSI
tara:strand:+ start:1233 stop:1778 length:546 start_codon:yes stop_codon:yes gene_type:complete